MKNYQFYHIYPLGMLDKLENNNERSLKDIEEFLPHMKEMKINGLLIGPIFESVYHGYETIDYLKIDQRLGTNNDFISLVQQSHNRGIDVIVDCVFNHVSREFFAFKDVLKNKETSPYKHWFNVNFDQNNSRQDGFTYANWDGHDELVKLNLQNAEVKRYLIQVALTWIDEFQIDGLRLDAADVMDRRFISELSDTLKNKKSGFFIVGEMVHGDYMGLLKDTGIDSVTNYECYKGLYSSLNDQNYFEIGHSFKRLLGKNGTVTNKYLYNFVDNHDVNRVASELKENQHVYPLYLMMYTMKGFTSIYYKSELGVQGKRTPYSDKELRQGFYLDELDHENDLLSAIKKFAIIRHHHPLLSFGEYEEVALSHNLICYRRYNENKSILTLINSSSEPQVIDRSLYMHWKNTYGLEGYDLLNEEFSHGESHLIIYPNWGCIIQ